MTPTSPAGTANPHLHYWFDKRKAMRAVGGQIQTKGLPDDVIERFAESDPLLGRAFDEAWEGYLALREEFPDYLGLDEADQAAAVQKGLVNFYAPDAVTPYVSLAARGPWIITTKGAVLHDSGGYGMLGMGHAPDRVLEAMSRPHAMANVITPNFSQLRLLNALRREIGRRHPTGCPFTGFLFMNSGSEAVTVAARISDINAKLRTDTGGTHAGKTIRRLSLKGGFHGRTDRPAQFSDSTLRVYTKHLATFRDRDALFTVEPNNVEQLREAFAGANARGEFIEALFMEPVLGEGNPGFAVNREFYDVARDLTKMHGALLLVDSIQAGLRTHGCLSIIDYPGFEDCDPPDMEAFSKALNAGQYPLSVLAMTPDVTPLFRHGVYGNTMTTNPRAMDVACAVLESVTPTLRANIRDRGIQLAEGLRSLAKEMDGPITGIQGTGLLVSCALDPEHYRAYGAGSTEEYLRTKGIGVIHGGANALRYTPHFAVTPEEIDLILDATRDALVNGPRKN